LTDDERQRVRALGGMDGASAQPARRSTASLLKNTPERERYAARLRYLCRLISRDRRPYCPLNGMLLLVPLAGSDTEDDTNQTGAICQLDLTTARQALQVQCPVFALICDMETAPGFREFIERFPAQARKQRLGQRFPLLPDLNEGVSVLDVIDSSVQWICQSLVPTWVYKLFQLERDREEFAGAIHGNALLYRLMGMMLGRQKRLGQLMKRALTTEQSAPWLFGGSYISGTGRDAGREQAFVAGVFRRLIDHQSAISWTPEALAEDADYHRWSTTGYTLMGLLTAAGVGLLVYRKWFM
jgi:type VI protein secretion system component VasK